MTRIKYFFASFLSRKFVLAAGGALTAFANREWETGAGIIGAYILAEAHIDAKSAAEFASNVAKKTVEAAG